MLTSRT